MTTLFSFRHFLLNPFKSIIFLQLLKTFYHCRSSEIYIIMSKNYARKTKPHLSAGSIYLPGVPPTF